MIRNTPEHFGSSAALGPHPSNSMKPYQYSQAGGYCASPGLGLASAGLHDPTTGLKVQDAYDASSGLLDTGLEDFFSPFLNPDFPIDIRLPMQMGEGAIQSQAPLMQVAQQNQSTLRRNPKLVGKRKLQTAAKARPQQGMTGLQHSMQPQGKTSSLSMLSPPSMGGSRSSPAPSYYRVDSSPSEDRDFSDGDEPNSKKQKRLVKNRQAAQLFRKRQKQYISDLENKVAEVTNKNIALMAKVDVLVSENQLVKDQLKYLRTFVVSALEQAFSPQKYGEMQLQLGDIGLHDAAKKEPNSGMPPTDGSF